MAGHLEYLYSLEQFGIKFGLDNIRALVEDLGHPERTFKVVHIAGTNGKGSVTAMVDAALGAAGHRSARYTSPHLVDLAERFVIEGRPVDQPDLIAAVGVAREAADRLLARGVLEAPPTFFEATTVAAFELFRRAEVEVAVCEVGLGGRLDATNVVSPSVTAITSIAHDHQQYLGTTLAEIAFEKAGIIKPRVPVVVGELEPSAAEVVERVAVERGARLVRAFDGVTARRVASTTAPPQRISLKSPRHDYGEVAIALDGTHQIGNAVVAVRVLEELDGAGVTVAPAAIARGLGTTRWPGRLERIVLRGGREALLDAAHNPAGAAALASYLSERGVVRPLVFAAMRDKDASGMLHALLPKVSPVIMTRASNARSADPRDLAVLAREVSPDTRVVATDSVGEALSAAWHVAPQIVVAGSIFLLGDVLSEIKRL
jgi:dihydrofolate synthase/folylpolyglutamate synthase